jgi:hypothetical protein
MIARSSTCSSARYIFDPNFCNHDRFQLSWWWYPSCIWHLSSLCVICRR